MRKFRMTLVVFAVSILSTIFFGSAYKVSALSGSEFQASRIIDDGIFFNSAGLDISTIQAFLNSKVPVCDTNGTQPYSGTTRAEYGSSRGYPPPFICLKDYRQDTPAKLAETGLCGAFAQGNKSAAQIIFEVAQNCSISPKVLIVLLEKEQSLVTDDWPWSIQYRSATGFGCPDTAPCDSEYYGFFNQVYNAARQFKRYARDESLFRYRTSRDNYIQYNPNTDCGGNNVFIQNQATAGLYNYTPYQPNTSALANLYGAGDGCGAYGNRNFWRMYIEWFGSTFANCTYPNSVTNGLFRLYHPGNNSHFITNSPVEVCNATSAGYVYDGQVFMSQASQDKPVFRLQKNSQYLYTLSTAERDFAITLGYKFEGIAFYAVDEVAHSETARPVYRFSNNGGYLYTISAAERDNWIAEGFKYEGIGFYLKENDGITSSPIYRLRHPSGAYLYTASIAERDNASQYYWYVKEGVSFDTITQLNALTVPIYRLKTSNGYFLTTSLKERASAVKFGYHNEGIATFTYGFNAPGLKHVYRLHHPNGAYLFTASEAEKDAAIHGGYVFESASFNAL